MRRILLVVTMFCTIEANAQTYLISFAGTGESTAVSTVEVENLTAGTFLTLNGDDILRLTLTTGFNSIEPEQSAGMKIYPNPMTDKSKLMIFTPDAGDAIISIYDISGKRLAQITSFVEKYTQEYAISGLETGLYFVNVKGDKYQFSGKIMSNGNPEGTARIVKVSDNIGVDKNVKKMNGKGVQATIDMEYTIGDRLKFTGISGDYSTVFLDSPSADKTITFNFISCTDGDGNSYPVVEIGTGTKGPQVWMAENLKTTSYSTGATIPLVTDITAWHDLLTPGYCWYDNNETAYKEAYGALYNWYTVGTGNLCPAGWHVPTEEEWITLADNLGGLAVAGGKLKETGTEHWANPNKGATNETGFTARGGGYRTHGGEYSSIFFYCRFWTSTEMTNDLNAIPFFIMYNYPILFKGGDLKRYAFSVRCLKD